MSKQQLFWLQDPSVLFHSPLTIVPREDMPLATRMNALSRMAIYTSIGIMLVDVTLGVVTLITSLVGISAAFYAQAKEESVEGFQEGDCFTVDSLFEKPTTDTTAGDDRCGRRVVVAERFCDDYRPFRFDDSHHSTNQSLAGSANPRTYVPPIIPARSHEILFWRDNDLVVRSDINDSTNFDVHKSGYLPDTRFTPISSALSPNPPPVQPSTRMDRILTQTISPNNVFQRTRVDEPINSMIGINRQKQFDPMYVAEARGGYVDYVTLDGEAPLSSGRHDDDDVAYDDDYNRPCTGHRHDGLLGGTRGSYDKDTDDNYDTTTTTLNDILRRKPKTIDVLRRPTEWNVFDPRFSGYADNDRHYIDEMTGQPRFDYSDIDAVKMPNYITRNNIDFIPSAPRYGSEGGCSEEEEGEGRRDYRDVANDAFLQATLRQRTELQERLLRKRNAEMWQLRVAPIRRN